MTRSIKLRGRGVIYCILLMTGSGHADPAPESQISLSRADQQRLGITVLSLVPAVRKTQIAAFAKVLDPGPLAQLASDLFAAQAAAAASGAEARRSAALHAADSNISAKDAEAAAAQAKSDESKRFLLRQRVGLEWGPGIARLTDYQLMGLLQALSHGQVALVHVDTPSNEGQKGAHTVDIDIGVDSVKGTVLGPARVAEPRLSSSGLLVEVSGPSSVLLSVGLTQSAHIDTGNPVNGIVLPRDALLRFRGSTWAYIKHGIDRFERRLAQRGVPEDGGLFVPQGFAAGEQVVTNGSAMLFAVEQSHASTQPAN